MFRHHWIVERTAIEPGELAQWAESEITDSEEWIAPEVEGREYRLVHTEEL